MYKFFLHTLNLLFIIVLLQSCSTGVKIEKEKNAKIDTTKSISIDKKEIEMLGIKLIGVHGSAYSRGSNVGNEDEMPSHLVTVGSFFIGKYEITNAQFCQFLNDYNSETVIDSTFKGQPILYESKNNADWSVKKVGKEWAPAKGKEDFPVINITRYGANEFCNWLSIKTNKKFRLPTEAEWEFAAKGGRNCANYTFSGSNNAFDVAWYDDSNGAKKQVAGTKKTGLKNKNELGIYDMSGNVAEWCTDWYSEVFYKHNKQDNPKGPNTGTQKVIRGGSWNYGSIYGKTNVRYFKAPDSYGNFIGFRVVCIP